MKPNAVRVAMARRGASLLVAFLSLAGPALAGDRALINFIGFSEDARYFAFEEFGIRDGSGFAYSSVYVVDLSTDSWVVGTPVRVEAIDEERSLADVRDEALEKSESHISSFGLNRPVEVVALIGDGVADVEAKSLVFGTPGYLPWTVSGDYELSLSTFDTKSATPCKVWFDIEPLGYELMISDQGAKRQVFRDLTLPRSRGCPFDYRLYGVIMPFQSSSLTHAVAIISVYPGAFEGPDRRFLAVPLGL